MYKWYVPTLWPEWFCLEPLLSTRGKYDRLMSLNGEKPAKGKVTWTAHLCYKLGWWTMLTHPIQRTILYIQYASILDLIYFTKTQLFILGLDGFFCLLLMKNIYVFDVANFMTKKKPPKNPVAFGIWPKSPEIWYQPAKISQWRDSFPNPRRAASLKHWTSHL